LKILILSDANSVHTQKWVQSLSERGIKVKLFSLFKPRQEILKKYKNINVEVASPDLKTKIKKLRQPNLSKLKYLSSLKFLNRVIDDYNPNIIHAHYASSYGFLAYLCKGKPLILSVWGSDVYDFPSKSIINKLMMKLVIKKSKVVCSTSRAMKNLIEKDYRRYDIKVIPFGVDVKKFRSDKRFKNFTVGTIKSIEEHNGIDCLIEAAKIVVKDYKKNIKFLIVGEGSMAEKMKQKTQKYKIEDFFNFAGFIDHKKIVDYYNEISIFVAVSTRESFGVSILEAAACEIPSITSNIGGLTEVNLHNETGIVINPNDPIKLAESIIKLFENDKLRLKYGTNGRKRVLEKFNWEASVDKMMQVYKSL